MVEKWIEKVFKVVQTSERIILAKLIVGQHMFPFLFVYAPPSSLSEEQSCGELWYLASETCMADWAMTGQSPMPREKGSCSMC